MVYVERIELITPEDTGSSNFSSLYSVSCELASSDFHSDTVITSGYIPLWGANRAPPILFRMSPFCFVAENTLLGIVTGVDIVKSLLYRELNRMDNEYVSRTRPVVAQPVMLDRIVSIITVNIVFISFPVQNVSVHPRRTLCAVVVERLVGFHFHRLFPFISQIVFVSPSVHPETVVQHHSFSSSNV